MFNLNFDLHFPAFGFASQKDIDELTTTYTTTRSFGDCGSIGYLNAQQKDEFINDQRGWAEQDASDSNKAKAYTYIPFLVNNIFIGYKRMKMAVEATEAPQGSGMSPPKSWRVAHFIRGLGEMFFLGPILFLIDLVVTAVRFIWNKQTEKKSAEIDPLMV